MNIKNELDRVILFINDYVDKDEIVMIPVSGGIDSDVVARLCVKALGKEHVRLFLIQQDDMEEKFLVNARTLATDLQVSLSEICLEGVNRTLIEALERGDKNHIFSAAHGLDKEKAKCSLRSAVISCYQDRGYLIAGTVNRTEWDLGFFLTFGDNLCHFNPIKHLYKSQVLELARTLGTRKEVIRQEPSAGFWKGQTDREDIAYWIINGGPILAPRDFSKEEVELAEKWKDELSVQMVDRCLSMFRTGTENKDISIKTGLDEKIVNGLHNLIQKAKKYKSRPVMVSLDDIR